MAKVTRGVLTKAGNAVDIRYKLVKFNKFIVSRNKTTPQSVHYGEFVSKISGSLTSRNIDLTLRNGAGDDGSSFGHRSSFGWPGGLIVPVCSSLPFQQEQQKNAPPPTVSGMWSCIITGEMSTSSKSLLSAQIAWYTGSRFFNICLARNKYKQWISKHCGAGQRQQSQRALTLPGLDGVERYV